jgi:predicted HTH domain antitoxin
MSLTIPEELLDFAQMSAEELRVEIAVLLFERDRLTLEQAARFAEMPRLRFQHLLASRKIPLHYTSVDLEQDLQTLRDLGHL